VTKDKGLLVVLSSPSGGGKTTIIHHILQQGHSDYTYSISMTTRPKRQGEKNGVDYLFVNEEEFNRHIKKGSLLEYERVHDWFYGTPKRPIEEWIREGWVVFLDLDVYGALQVKNLYKSQCLLVFLKPPSLEELRTRLKNRSTETREQIERRLKRVPREMELAEKFD